MSDNPHDREADLAFMTLALGDVERHGQPDCRRDVLIGRLFTELAELVRRGNDLNQIEQIYPLLSHESRIVFSAALNSICENPARFVASFGHSDRMMGQAEAHAAWRRNR
jgi:hypothetical protein